MTRNLSFETLLLLFGIFITVLVGARVMYTGTGHFLFLLWNLFLAAMPYFIVKYALYYKGRSIANWLVLAAWLLFFPNALYIVTDLIHLQTPGAVPVWFDAVLIFSASVLGLILGFASLHKVESYLRQWYKPALGNVLVPLFLFLGAFGVYLGRFQRWNSWDIISDPLDLLCGVAHRFIYPFEHGRTWGTTFLLSGLFYLLYGAIKKMPGYLNRAS